MTSRLRSCMVHSVQNSAIWHLVIALQSPSWGPIRVSRQFLSREKLSEKYFEQHLKREFGRYMEDEMGRKVRFSALHRTAPRLARDFSDSFSTHFVNKGVKRKGRSPEGPGQVDDEEMPILRS